MPFFQRQRKAVQGAQDHPLTSAVAMDTTMAGRRYRQDVPYLLPKDVQEVNRLDFQHYLMRQIFKGNYIAPLNVPGTILDVGCGTGRWGMEMCQEFPDAYVTGVDLETPSLAEPASTRYRFVQANILNGLPFADQSFAFVHQRFLVTALPERSWSPLIEELIRVTASNGWLELMEVTHIIAPQGPAGKQMRQWIEQICIQRGIDPLLPQKLGPLLTASPLLTDVHFQYVDIPVGDWGGRIGSLLARDYYAVYEGVKPLYVKHLQIQPDQYERMLVAMRQEWERFQSTSRVYVAYGCRK